VEQRFGCVTRWVEETRVALRLAGQWSALLTGIFYPLEEDYICVPRDLGRR
jgi:hypothetical protein